MGEFTGWLENKGGKFFFSEMKPVAEIDWSKTPPFPYFRLAFARENDTVTNTSDNDTDAETFPIVLDKNDEPRSDPRYEIGFIIEKEDGALLGDSGCNVDDDTRGARS